MQLCMVIGLVLPTAYQASSENKQGMELIQVVIDLIVQSRI